ncbi:MAG: peptide chain release factor N(5)-glutamine methyltransferase [Acidimicrobiia bacterium]|nr:peptide chain release factor N(5)-glutamine methyltransferase [Acidimicrobiia bacterium]
MRQEQTSSALNRRKNGLAGVPPHEAERLLAVATGRARHELLVDGEVSSAEEQRYRDLVKQRLAGVPLQHLEGTVQFGPIEIRSDARALVPRPETEHLWEEAVTALGEAGPGTVIVDLCTGSGNLALALKHAFPAARVYATDLSPEALALAAENAANLALEVSFLEGDLFDPLPGELYERVDLLVANPPYVAESEFERLPVEVRDHDPRQALVAGPVGDEVLARIAADAYWWMGTGGWLFCEIGETQSERALELFGAYLDVEIRPDLAGRPRILVGRKGGRCCV